MNTAYGYRSFSVFMVMTCLLLFSPLQSLVYAQISVKNHAEFPECGEIPHLVREVLANSTKELDRERTFAGSSYMARVVYAARKFELHPHDRNAVRTLLELIPQNLRQDIVWGDFGMSLCEAESLNEAEILDGLGERLNHDLSRAVLIEPSKMERFVAYTRLSISPSSDLLVQMEPVCRLRHAAFAKAVQKLPPDSRQWMKKHLFNVKKCKALYLPEASEP